MTLYQFNALDETEQHEAVWNHGANIQLINNNEDGLFSRFLVMTFESDPKWNDVGPCPDCKNLTAFFKEQSREYYKLWEFLSKQEILVELTPIQWRTINSYCDAKNTEIHEDHGPAASSVIKRRIDAFQAMHGTNRYESV